MPVLRSRKKDVGKLSSYFYLFVLCASFGTIFLHQMYYDGVGGGDHDDTKGVLPTVQQTQQQTNEAAIAKQPLNVLILFVDDMAHDSLSSAGTRLVQTPFLDSLVDRGVRFTQNCVTTSICWLSRATLFTGMYATRHLSWRLKTPRFCDNWNTTAWPALLQRLGGYHVGHIGKWQYSNTDFVYKVFDYANVFQFQHWLKVDGKRIHVTDHTRNETIKFLRERPKDKPFAATIAFYPPKGIDDKNFDNFKPKPSSMGLYENVTIPVPFEMNFTNSLVNKTIYHEKNLAVLTYYYGLGMSPELYQHNMKDMYRMITEVDEACRDIFGELELQGILDETMVIFTADNGVLSGEHGLGGKWFPWDPSIRVPLIVWDPRMPAAKRGTLDDSLTLNVDLAPTILAAAGIPAPSTMQGRDFSVLYRGGEENSDNSHSHIHHNHKDDWRQDFYYFHPSQGGGITQSSALVVNRDLKYVRYDLKGVEELYDLRTDPMELNNVYNNPVYASRLQNLKERYEELKGRADSGSQV